MKKLLLRLFCPGAEDAARLAAKTIAEFVNGSGKEELIAKYGAAADEFTKVQAKVTGWLRDGKMSEDEQEELYRALLPLAERLVEEIKR